MATITTPTGETFEETNAEALNYYRREPGYLVDGEDGLAVPTVADVQVDGEQPAVPQVPALSALKPEWVDYALAVDPENAAWINDSSTTKDDLIAAYSE